MKKTIITAVVTAVITIAITLLGVVSYNSYKEEIYSKQVAKTGLKEIKETKFNLPKFSISLFGVYYSTITNEDLKELKTYEISAVMTDGIYNDLYYYKGVKLKDVFELSKIEDYKNVTLKSNGNLQVTFSKEEITDDMYLVFEQDGISLPEDEPVNLLNTSLHQRYSISNVVRMDFE